MAKTPLLYITDGTTIINLIGGDFRLDTWTPGFLSHRGGGQWTTPPLADGRRLQSYQWDNLTEIFGLTLAQKTEDIMASGIGALFRLLQQAADYWVSDWVDTPVWIAARGRDETNARYAVIRGYQAGNVEQQLQSALGNDVTNSPNRITVAIEHGLWLSHEPGTDGQSVEGSNLMTYNGQTYGQEATAARDVMIANHYKTSNITHAFDWLQPAGPFSANKIGMALPFDLFPGGVGVPVTGDMIYFGIDSTLGGATPFTSLVFDITTAAVYAGLDNVAWQYWNGAWVNLTVWDNTETGGDGGVTTQPFEESGVNSIHWAMPGDWIVTAVNGVTGWWVRGVVAVPTGISRARQGNRNIYTCSLPYIDIAANQVGGDLPALARVRFQAQSDDANAAITLYIPAQVDRVIMGLRSTDREQAAGNFCAYLNAADTGGPTYTASVVHVLSSWQADPYAALARCCRWQPAAIIAMSDVLSIIFRSGAANYSPDYGGQYHCFLRYRVLTGADGDVMARIAVGRGSQSTPVSQYTETVPLAASGTAVRIADMGRIQIPDFGAATPTWQSGLMVQLQSTQAAARDVRLYDIIIIPADEWMADSQQILTNALVLYWVLGDDRLLDMDSITRPKQTLWTPVMTEFTVPTLAHFTDTQYLTSAAGPCVLQEGKRQRLWFFMQRGTWTVGVTIGISLPRKAEAWLAGRVEVDIVQRYSYLRGDQ